ncbi:MAG TPA: hypothetical protein PKK38_07940 [Bacteroidales bacterium]|jgi:hypothetical protein|nr:hypothetical protein [Bacteroidales bacterium]
MNWFVDIKPENDESHAKTRYEQQSKFEKITGQSKENAKKDLIAVWLFGIVFIGITVLILKLIVG